LFVLTELKKKREHFGFLTSYHPHHTYLPAKTHIQIPAIFVYRRLSAVPRALPFAILTAAFFKELLMAGFYPPTGRTSTDVPAIQKICENRYNLWIEPHF